MAMKVSSANKAIDVLGGTQAVADIFGCNYRVVLNWRRRGFPPDTYWALAPELMLKGHTFSPLLFAQKLRRADTERRASRD